MRNKVSPKEKQNDDELTKSLTLYVNKKLKKMEDAEDIFGKTVANGLQLITNIRNHEFVKLKIHELLFQNQFGTFRNQQHSILSTLSQFQVTPYRSLSSER